MWEGPGAQSFQPKSIAILPPMASQYGSAREIVQDVLASALRDTKRFDKVLSQDEVTDVFQGSKEAFDALVLLFSRLETTGQTEQEAVRKIGKALAVEALMVVRVNAWEYLKTETENQAKVRLTLRLMDVSTGSIVWSARHERTSSFLFFRPHLKDVASELATDMLIYLPKPNGTNGAAKTQVDGTRKN
jgi:hypothetical protein